MKFWAYEKDLDERCSRKSLSHICIHTHYTIRANLWKRSKHDNNDNSVVIFRAWAKYKDTGKIWFARREMDFCYSSCEFNHAALINQFKAKIQSFSHLFLSLLLLFAVSLRALRISCTHTQTDIIHHSEREERRWDEILYGHFPFSAFHSLIFSCKWHLSLNVCAFYVIS